MGTIGGYDTDYSALLGQGNYGSVYKIRNKESGEFAAAKRIVISSADAERKFKAVENEINAIKNLGSRHSNIIKMFKTQKDEDGFRNYVWIITEFCTLKDLEIYAEEHCLNTGHHLDIMQQASSGLAFMHGQNPPIIHRDVKPSNILMTEEGGKHVVKLADFGIARRFTSEKSKQTMTVGGTLSYMGPELFDEIDKFPKMDAHYHRNGAQDCFSFGITSYQIVQAKPGTALLCPEVTETCIGKMILKIREVEMEVDESKTKSAEDFRRKRESRSWLAKKMESKEKREAKEKSHQEEMANLEEGLRVSLWEGKKLREIKDMEPVKEWNPIVTNDTDSDIVKRIKELIRSVVCFDPKERNTMAGMKAALEELKKSVPAPGVPEPYVRP